MERGPLISGVSVKRVPKIGTDTLAKTSCGRNFGRSTVGRTCRGPSDT